MDYIEEQIEYIDTNQALEIFRKHPIAKKRYTANRQTLLSWAEKYDLGYKFAGRWQIDKVKLIKFLDSGVK
jgi:hypothetical protein